MDQDIVDRILAMRQTLAQLSAAPTRKSIQKILRQAPKNRRRLLRYLLLFSDIKPDWDADMAQLRDIDSEVAQLLDDALATMQEDVEVFDFSSRIVNVAYGCFYAGSDRDLVIRLIFKRMQGKTVISDQDLEDTLQIANSVMTAVVDMMKSIVTDQTAPERIELGSRFSDLAKEAVVMTNALSRYHSAYLKATENSTGTQPAEEDIERGEE